MTAQPLDITGNRCSEKYTNREQLMRVLWWFVVPFFRFSPYICFGWRRMLLRLFGAKVGEAVNIYNSAIIYMPWNLTIGDWSSIGENALIYNLGKIAIGERTTISHRAHLCAGTHDYNNVLLPLLKPPISVGDQAWVCTDAFIGPGVIVGEGAVVGARAVVTKNVVPWSVVAGNPAKNIRMRVVRRTSQNAPS